MAGYIHDPLQIINLIADNLRDRYESDSVLKEIIQNADDAGSSDEKVSLEFGFSEGLAAAEHALLKGPALYFINNGKFEDSDDIAIRSFGLNRKAIEQSSIGKFGLGMKSVFHFCEAFFFLAKNSEKQYLEILNPWAGGEEFPSLHDNWNKFVRTDAKLMVQHVKPVFSQMKFPLRSWFLLWVPLRQRSHLLVNGKKIGSIISEFPGDDERLLSFLFEPDLAQKLASLLPLLRRITSIRFWHADEKAAKISMHFQVLIKEGSNRVELTEGSGIVREIAGTIGYQYNGNVPQSYSLVYSGDESLPDVQELRLLRQSPFWPKSYIRDELNVSKEAPDKSREHCAAVFSRSNEKQSGILKIRWAVFLPVEEAKEEVPCSGDSCYRLTLHGYFFVDAGRIDIEGLQETVNTSVNASEIQNEKELRRIWNMRLANQGTLPLILSALEKFIYKARLSADDVWYLSDALRKSDLFQRNKENICSSSLWACCLTRKGKEWNVLPSESQILPLLRPPTSEPDRPWNTLPKLESLENRKIIFLQKDAPHLIPNPLPQWNESYLLEILHFDEKDVFSNLGKLEYLHDFLADSAVNPFLQLGSLQERLREILNNAFITLGNDLRQYRKKVQEIVSFLDADSRYAIRQDAPQIMCELQRCKTRSLILPNEFDAPGCPGNARLSFEDSLVLLQKLHDLIIHFEKNDDQSEINSCRVIARDILLNQEEDQLREILIRAKNLRIIDGYDCLTGKLSALSVSELEETREDQLLFLYSQGTTDEQRRGLAPKMQQAISGRVLLVRSETANLLFGRNHLLVSCQAESVLDSLGGKIQQLQSIEKRRELISAAAGADLLSDRRVRGLRYLLHGFEDQFEDNSTLWVTGYEQNPVWGKLWRQLVSQNENGWNLLNRKLVAKIPQDKWPNLSIREIKSEDILGELRDQGTEKIIGEEFTPDERNAVLKELANDEDLWKNLPFHETVAETLVRIIPGRSFLETDIILPDELHSCADIIRLAEDPTIKRQQKDWLVLLTPEGVIEIALQYEEPSKFWRLIMNHLGPLMQIKSSDLFRDTAWLIDLDALPVKPSDVIFLENMQDEVDRLIAVARGAFWSPGKLLKELCDHEAFDILKEFSFSSGKEGFEKLALLLGETCEYHVGEIRVTHENFLQIVTTCARFPHDFHMPGWNLLAKALEAYSIENFIDLLLPEMAKPITVDRIISILKWLQEEHTKVGKSLKMEVLAAFNAYLVALVNTGGGKGELIGLLLLDREGKWRPAIELCAGAEGVADSHLLDDKQKHLLKDVIIHADRTEAEEFEITPQKRDLQPEITASADNLKDFFSEWEGLVAPEIICAFLSLLGDDPDILALAERYSGKHSVEWVRENIPWEIHHRTDSLHRGEWMYGIDQHQAFKQHRFIVTCLDGEMVKTTSIIGKGIEVPLKSQFDSLIIGGLYYEYPSGGMIFPRLQLRKTNIDSTLKLSKLLQSSAEYILNKAYNQRNYDLSELWEDLDRSEQLDIRIAEQLVLNHIPFYMRLLGVHKHPRLQELLSAWNEARYRREEYYETKDKRESYEREQRKILSEIQILLTSDEEVQEVVLNSVRAKMRDFQYTTASIPFELFQNADDAVVELAEIKAYPNDPAVNSNDIIPVNLKRFLVIREDNSLSFVHWGRPINFIGSRGFPGRVRGFHQDLEKMLVLSSSDKSSEPRVTGKFGLGFKSVLLASDRPQLMSGRLATEIIAGLCPIPLHDSSSLRSRLYELSSDRRWHGTIIKLQLSEIKSAQVMESFKQLAGIMTIFSKMIRRIDIDDTDKSDSWEWRPNRISISDTFSLEIGELPFRGGLHQGGLSAYFRLTTGGILIGLGSGGFRKLPSEFPAIWVVAPTKESEGIGFAINSLFDLDAGRARLAGNSPVNKQKADELGRAFGAALKGLYDITQGNWEELKGKLRLEKDLSVYSFWSTLWQVMSDGIPSRSNDEVSQLLRLILCDENGFGYLITEADALPNGLWDSFQVLTRPENIRLVLKGCLINEQVFKTIIKWEYFRNLLENPESVIADPVYSIARKVVPSIGQTSAQWRTVNLSDVLYEYGQKKKNVTPQMAAILAPLLNPADLKQEYFENERAQIERALYRLYFEAEDGSFQSANELIVSQKHALANPDESKRAIFAPEKYLLSQKYQERSVNFFFLCREKISIPVEEMANWIFDAPTEGKKEGGLRYILDGEHGEKIAEILREQGLGGTWLSKLRPDSSFFEIWDEKDVSELLLRKLPSIEELIVRYVFTEDEDFELPEDELRRHNPEDILQRIHTWWANKKEEHIAQYEQRTYPDNALLDLEEDEFGRIDRKSWLILFTLSHFHTIGRQKDVQHKGFIEMCIDRGWWDVFSKENPEQRADEWMNVLEEYIDKQVDLSEYEHWMNRFPTIYRFARWLTEYSEVFLNLDGMEKLTDIRGILKTRTYQGLQGGGLSAPPIEKSLGIGACFILRELKRKQLLKGNQVIPFCYVPVKRVLELFRKIGCNGISETDGIDNSKTIYHFLCQNLDEQKATFFDDYDIPLQVLAKEQKILKSILDQGR
jgi:hypothetical protein